MPIKETIKKCASCKLKKRTSKYRHEFECLDKIRHKLTDVCCGCVRDYVASLNLKRCASCWSYIDEWQVFDRAIGGHLWSFHYCDDCSVLVSEDS
jgi:hypothetical protein